MLLSLDLLYVSLVSGKFISNSIWTSDQNSFPYSQLWETLQFTSPSWTRKPWHSCWKVRWTSWVEIVHHEKCILRLEYRPAIRLAVDAINFHWSREGSSSHLWCTLYSTTRLSVVTTSVSYGPFVCVSIERDDLKRLLIFQVDRRVSVVLLLAPCFVLSLNSVVCRLLSIHPFFVKQIIRLLNVLVTDSSEWPGVMRTIFVVNLCLVWLDIFSRKCTWLLWQNPRNPATLMSSSWLLSSSSDNNNFVHLLWFTVFDVVSTSDSGRDRIAA